METVGDGPGEMWLLLNDSPGDEERPGDLGYAINTFADVILWSVMSKNEDTGMSDESTLMRDNWPSQLGPITASEKNLGLGGLLGTFSCTLLWSLQKPQLILQESEVRTTCYHWQMEPREPDLCMSTVASHYGHLPQGGNIAMGTLPSKQVLSDLSAATAPSSPGSDGALDVHASIFCKYWLQSFEEWVFC